VCILLSGGSGCGGFPITSSEDPEKDHPSFTPATSPFLSQLLQGVAQGELPRIHYEHRYGVSLTPPRFVTEPVVVTMTSPPFPQRVLILWAYGIEATSPEEGVEIPGEIGPPFSFLPPEGWRPGSFLWLWVYLELTPEDAQRILRPFPFLWHGPIETLVLPPMSFSSPPGAQAPLSPMSSLSPGNQVSFTLSGSSSRTIISVYHGELSPTCSYNGVIVSSISESWGGGEICRSSSYYDVSSASGDSSCTGSYTNQSERTYCERGGLNFIGFSSLTRTETRTWAPGCWLWGEYGYTYNETWTRQGILELPELPQDCPNGAYVLEGNGFSYEGGSNAPSFLSGTQCRDRGGSPYPPQPQSCTYEQSQSCSGTFHDMVAGRTDGKTRYPFPSPGGPPQIITCHSQDQCVTWDAKTIEIYFTTNNPFRATLKCECDKLFSFPTRDPPHRQGDPRWGGQRYNLATDGSTIGSKGCAMTNLCTIINCNDVGELNDKLVKCTENHEGCFDSNHNVHWEKSCKYLGESCSWGGVTSPTQGGLGGLWGALTGDCEGVSCLDRIRRECWNPIVRLCRNERGKTRCHYVFLREVATGGASSPGQFIYRVADPAGYHATLNDYLDPFKDSRGWWIDGIRFIKRDNCNVRSCP